MVADHAVAADLAGVHAGIATDGDTVPADARLIQAIALQTAEGSLTGESLPVAKDVLPIGEEAVLGDRHNMVFSGTAVMYGRGRAVVVAEVTGRGASRSAGAPAG